MSAAQRSSGPESRLITDSTEVVQVVRRTATLIAATTWPERSRIGAAIDRRPGASSSSATATSAAMPYADSRWMSAGSPFAIAGARLFALPAKFSASPESSIKVSAAFCASPWNSGCDAICCFIAARSRGSMMPSASIAPIIASIRNRRGSFGSFQSSTHSKYFP